MNIKKLLNSKSGRLAVAAVLGAGVLVGVTVAANGAVKPDCKSLSYPLCARSVAASQVVDNSLPASKIVPADRNAFLKDVNGKAGVTVSLPPKAIEHIGGSFKTQKTKIGEFTLPAGTWLINTSAFFARTAVGVEGTRPQLALRVGASVTDFGIDVGTILGAEISPSKDRELSGSTVKVLKVPANGSTKVEVFAFGYNDDAGSAGSGDITAAADIVAVQVG